MYHRRAHKQTSEILKGHSHRATSAASSRYSRRVALSILLSGPIIAAGVMTGVYAAVGPDPQNHRPVASSKQKDEAEDDLPAPVDVTINGEQVPVPESGDLSTEIPLDNGSASVDVSTQPTETSADVTAETETQTSGNSSNSSNVDVRVYGNGSGSVEVDISQHSRSSNGRGADNADRPTPGGSMPQR